MRAPLALLGLLVLLTAPLAGAAEIDLFLDTDPVTETVPQFTVGDDATLHLLVGEDVNGTYNATVELTGAIEDTWETGPEEGATSRNWALDTSTEGSFTVTATIQYWLLEEVPVEGSSDGNGTGSNGTSDNGTSGNATQENATAEPAGMEQENATAMQWVPGPQTTIVQGFGVQPAPSGLPLPLLIGGAVVVLGGGAAYAVARKKAQKPQYESRSQTMRDLEYEPRSRSRGKVEAGSVAEQLRKEREERKQRREEARAARAAAESAQERTEATEGPGDAATAEAVETPEERQARTSEVEAAVAPEPVEVRRDPRLGILEQKLKDVQKVLEKAEQRFEKGQITEFQFQKIQEMKGQERDRLQAEIDELGSGDVPR